MQPAQPQSCIAACKRCAAACDDCVANALRAPNVHAMQDCVALAFDCAEVCRLTMAYLERDRPTASAICKACVDVCERCQAECDKYQMDYCGTCAEACYECAAACRAVIACAELEARSHDSVVAGLRQ